MDIVELLFHSVFPPLISAVYHVGERKDRVDD